jgi:hypothetical protein
MKIEKAVRGIPVSLLLAASLWHAAPAQALTSTEALNCIQAAKVLPANTTIDVWVVGNQVIAVVGADLTATDAYLGKQAGTIAQSIFAPSASNAQQVTVIYTDKTGAKTYHAFTMTPNQAAEIARVGVYDPRSTPATVGEKAYIAGAAAMGAFRIEPAGVSMYNAKRSALMVRIKMLQGQGVGVKPYLDQMTQIDDRLKTSGPENAALALGTLEKTVAEQEKARAAVNKPTAVNGNTVQTDIDSLIDTMKDFNGSAEEYKEVLKAALIQKEIGFPVSNGPFLVERIRIAQMIHHNQSQGKDMSGPINIFGQIDNQIKSKDPRKLREIVPQIQYLQNQLGLKQLR